MSFDPVLDDFPDNYGIGSHYKKHTFTVQDLAGVTGRAEGTIRNDMSKGLLDMDRFADVARYIVVHGLNKANRLRFSA